MSCPFRQPLQMRGSTKTPGFQARHVGSCRTGRITDCPDWICQTQEHLKCRVYQEKKDKPKPAKEYKPEIFKVTK